MHVDSAKHLHDLPWLTTWWKDLCSDQRFSSPSCQHSRLLSVLSVALRLSSRTLRFTRASVLPASSSAHPCIVDSVATALYLAASFSSCVLAQRVDSLEHACRRTQPSVFMHTCTVRVTSDPVRLRQQLLLEEGRESLIEAAAGGLCTVDASPAHPLKRLEESNGVQGIQVNKEVPFQFIY